MQRKDLAQTVARLNATTWADDATGLLDQVLNRGLVGQVAMVSSFGAESAVLLHLLAQVQPAAPVFPEFGAGGGIGEKRVDGGAGFRSVLKLVI